MPVFPYPSFCSQFYRLASALAFVATQGDKGCAIFDSSYISNSPSMIARVHLRFFVYFVPLFFCTFKHAVAHETLMTPSIFPHAETGSRIDGISNADFVLVMLTVAIISLTVVIVILGVGTLLLGLFMYKTTRDVKDTAIDAATRTAEEKLRDANEILKDGVSKVLHGAGIPAPPNDDGGGRTLPKNDIQ